MTSHQTFAHFQGHLDPAIVTEGEMIEREALRSLHDGATPAIRRDLRLGWRETPDATMSIAAALPPSAIVINRAFLKNGAGAGATVQDYRATGVHRAFLHLPCDRPSSVLEVPGLQPARPWQKFVRTGRSPLPEAPSLDIERVGPGRNAADVAHIVCAAFDLGGAAEDWLARLSHDRRWQVFIARINGVPAGTGALFISAGVGWCDWGATAPAFRGRGVQLALLRHRLSTAEALGLERIHTCTGAPAPGDPQHSYRNILRCGFAETILRGNIRTDDQ
jgi:GNAT superfamily N-acetyltransferase